MIVIVEGADLVGKSTVANAIALRRGWPVVKIRWALLGDLEIETRVQVPGQPASKREDTWRATSGSAVAAPIQRGRCVFGCWKRHYERSTEVLHD
jgi:hypothetical protein